jgi:hypothetical protein
MNMRMNGLAIVVVSLVLAAPQATSAQEGRGQQGAGRGGRGQEGGPAAQQTGTFPSEAKNLTLLSHTYLNGHGDGGESMEIQQWPDGRRVLYFVHQGAENCLSVVDVTKPDKPEVLVYLPSPNPGDTQCNAVGLSGNVLAVANWTTNATQKGHKGFWLLDVSSPERILKAKSLQDLAFSFYDADKGPHTRGSHWLWFVDGEFVHLAMTADTTPTANGHDLMYIIVDVRDRKNPREVARWWVPGTMKGDACLPGCEPHGGHPSRAHNIQVYADRPDRAYVGYFGAGWYILDISGLADVKAGRVKTFTPKVVSNFTTGPAFPVNSHTLQPIPGTKYGWAADEAVNVQAGPEKCNASPKMLWLMDLSAETNPLPVGYAPFAENAAELCLRPGRYGPYNLHMNTGTPTSKTLKNTMVISYFGGGLRIFRLVPVPVLGNVPPRIVEIGHFIPDPPQGAPASELGGVLVGNDGTIYVNDRRVGGLYILRYTGKEPLD